MGRCRDDFNSIKSIWKQSRDEFRHNHFPTLTATSEIQP